MKKNNLILGCIADDFTGASDAASFIAKSGALTVLCDGVPESLEHCGDCQAIVIALKSRSIPKDEAVSESGKAFEFLDRLGAGRFYFKYCSTFDSTREGNIGPVGDSIMEKYGVRYTLLCPSLPVNRRIVKDGRLIVDGIPLNQGHMKNHPLNPMWDSYISRLMEPQSKYPCLVLGADVMRLSAQEILSKVEDYGSDKEHFYVIPEYASDDDGRKIAEVFGGNRFLTGGSGLLEHLATGFAGGKAAGYSLPNATAGRGIALCGSCSKATGEQVRSYKASGKRYVTLAPEQLLRGEQSVEKIWSYVCEEPDSEVLVYSNGAEIPVKKTGDAKVDESKSRILELTMAELGKRAYDAGYTRIIVGGGETSGAVTQALSLDSFYIGESVAPGVPIMTPTTDSKMRIVLKSGNFGQKDFFERALDMTRINK